MGQDHTAEQGTTANKGTGQTAEGTATWVAEAIPVMGQQLETTTDSHPESATDHPAEATDTVQPLTTAHTIFKIVSTHYTSTA